MVGVRTAGIRPAFFEAGRVAPRRHSEEVSHLRRSHHFMRSVPSPSGLG